MKKLFKINGSCALQALRFLSGEDERSILAAFISQGMTEFYITETAKRLGIKLKEVNVNAVEVRAFIKKYPTGTFLITTVNHAFVIQDGVQIDAPVLKSPGTRRTINRAWRVKVY